MPTTKPPRDRHRERPKPKDAPRYPALKREDYAQLEEDGQVRHDLHLEVDSIVDALQYARLDKRSHGFPTNVSLDKGAGGGMGVSINEDTGEEESRLTSVEAWSQRRDTASEWLAEYAETRATLIRTGRLARFHYGYDPERGKDEPGRPIRQNEAIPCAWCGDPTVTGNDEHGRVLTRRIDGKIAIHARPCYETASKQAQRSGTVITTLIVQRVKPDA